MVPVSLSIGAVMVPSLDAKVVVPIGPITPAEESATINPLREISPSPLKTNRPPLLKSFSPVKRKADSSTSTSEVLVETTESPVVCPAANASLGHVIERHVRSPHTKPVRMKRTASPKVEDGSARMKKTTPEDIHAR